EDVVAVAAVEHVVSGAAGQRVVAEPAGDGQRRRQVEGGQRVFAGSEVDREARHEAGAGDLRAVRGRADRRVRVVRDRAVAAGDGVDGARLRDVDAVIDRGGVAGDDDLGDGGRHGRREVERRLGQR